MMTMMIVTTKAVTTKTESFDMMRTTKAPVNISGRTVAHVDGPAIDGRRFLLKYVTSFTSHLFVATGFVKQTNERTNKQMKRSNNNQPFL